MGSHRAYAVRSSRLEGQSASGPGRVKTQERDAVAELYSLSVVLEYKETLQAM
jgi:hypothetical protein